MSNELSIPLGTKRPRPEDDFYDSLICPICSDYYKPPVIQCMKGHSYCSECVAKQCIQNFERNCAICRAVVNSDIRNFAIESLLEKSRVKCGWRERGCKEKVSLANRVAHEQQCSNRPMVSCYYEIMHECPWKGDPQALPGHLIQTHDVQELTRGGLFRYLWNPPSEHVWRYRFRILKYQANPPCEPFVFILEHYYCNKTKLLVFLIRSPDSNIKRKYRLSILNRNDDTNRITFESTTCSFDEASHIKDFLESGLTKFMVVPYKQLKEFCFF